VSQWTPLPMGRLAHSKVNLLFFLSYKSGSQNYRLEVTHDSFLREALDLTYERDDLVDHI
jgi:hypothetical protein